MRATNIFMLYVCFSCDYVVYYKINSYYKQYSGYMFGDWSRPLTLHLRRSRSMHVLVIAKIWTFITCQDIFRRKSRSVYSLKLIDRIVPDRYYKRDMPPLQPIYQYRLDTGSGNQSNNAYCNHKTVLYLELRFNWSICTDKK